jgi:exodeoxyribonuclease-3
MRILSYNVNGIRAIEKKGFLDWLAKDSPDILCLQETKASPVQLSPALLTPVDGKGKPYLSFFASAKKAGYSGTAIYTRERPLSVEPLGIARFDDEGRVLKADYGDFVLYSCYFPNSQDERARLQYKLDFCAAIKKECSTLVKKGKHFIVCGDYNIAHKPIDLEHPKANENNAGYYPEERAFMDEFLACGFIDTFRYFYPDKKRAYSWWSYRGGAREHNVGWRLDYFCVDGALMPKVESAAIRAEITGSDHCPVEIEVKP